MHKWHCFANLYIVAFLNRTGRQRSTGPELSVEVETVDR